MISGSGFLILNIKLLRFGKIHLITDQDAKNKLITSLNK